MEQHSQYKFSVTLHSNDLSVINALRALSQHNQKTGNARIPWGGTKTVDWAQNDHMVTFRFSSPEYRIGFLNDANRVLTSGSFSIAAQSDNDPAQKQSE